MSDRNPNSRRDLKGTWQAPFRSAWEKGTSILRLTAEAKEKESQREQKRPAISGPSGFERISGQKDSKKIDTAIQGIEESKGKYMEKTIYFEDIPEKTVKESEKDNAIKIAKKREKDIERKAEEKRQKIVDDFMRPIRLKAEEETQRIYSERGLEGVKAETEKLKAERLAAEREKIQRDIEKAKQRDEEIHRRREEIHRRREEAQKHKGSEDDTMQSLKSNVKRAISEIHRIGSET